MRIRHRKRQERGVTTVEYAILIAGMLGMVSVAAGYLGDSTAQAFANAQIALDEGVNDCPNSWQLVGAGQTKKNGQNVDANGDGFICEKNIPGRGKGNTNQNKNVKDNN